MTIKDGLNYLIKEFQWPVDELKKLQQAKDNLVEAKANRRGKEIDNGNSNIKTVDS